MAKLAAAEGEKAKLAAELAKLKADGEKAEKDRAAEIRGRGWREGRSVAAELEKLEGATRSPREKDRAAKLAAAEAEKTKLAAELAKLKADGEKAEKDRAAKSAAADGEKAKLTAELEKLKGDAVAAEKDRAAKSAAADGEKAKLTAELEKLKGDAVAAGEVIARRNLRPRTRREGEAHGGAGEAEAATRLPRRKIARRNPCGC